MADEGIAHVLADLRAQIAALSEGSKRHSRKTNREIRRLKEENEQLRAAKATPGATEVAAETKRQESDDKQAREAAKAKALEDALAEHLKSLSPEAREKLGNVADLSTAEKAIALLKIHGATVSKPAADPAPGAQPVNGTGGRGPGPATMGSTPHPRSMSEFAKLPPEQRAKLMADDSFDPERLPPVVR